MFNEKNCLENLKHIVSEYADDENLKNLSLDELRSSYTEIADNIFSISVSNCLKYKNMLWNIEYLKPGIRSKFQTELFNVWHSIYVKSEKTGPAEGLPEIIQQESAFVEEVEKSLKIDAPKQTSIEREKLKSDTLSEDTDFSSEIKPVKKQSPTTAQNASIKKYENDWFDKILDFFAAIVGSVSGIVGH
ncbi:MAG TPA: hypothetical protein VLM43_03575 [Desulfobacterales bacterium]|nr:hypothetical protein [Desulfobacterales bacterium]